MDLRHLLPEDYIERMRRELGDAFIDSYRCEPTRGLRFNLIKCRRETREKLVGEWDLRPVPWCRSGYYYDPPLRPGLSPYHAAGIYYIQEPSAMSAAEKADLYDGCAVLDMCAAPGGKSARLAEGAGVLIANDIDPQRARTLSSNIERMGYANVIVTQAQPKDLAEVFGPVFDRILVDAPCSGEGLFRKSPEAVREWDRAAIGGIALRQSEILESAYALLRPGGKLIYSTCTFEKAENEDRLSHLCERHPDMEIIGSETLYPHMVRGEGHFVGVMARAGGSLRDKPILSDVGRALKFINKNKLRIHILRAGITPGVMLTDSHGLKYYKPSQAEIMARVYEEDTGGKINILSVEMAVSYLKGESLRLRDTDTDAYELSAGDGFISVYFDGYPLGLAKLSSRVLKNHYPKGLRFY